MRDKVIAISRTATMTTMNQQDLGNIKVPVPPLNEQKRITSSLKQELATVEKLEQSLQEQLDAINKLPATLLRQAFNGEF